MNAMQGMDPQRAAMLDRLRQMTQGQGAPGAPVPPNAIPGAGQGPAPGPGGPQGPPGMPPGMMQGQSQGPPPMQPGMNDAITHGLQQVSDFLTQMVGQMDPADVRRELIEKITLDLGKVIANQVTSETPLPGPETAPPPAEPQGPEEPMDMVTANPGGAGGPQIG